MTESRAGDDDVPAQPDLALEQGVDELDLDDLVTVRPERVLAVSFAARRSSRRAFVALATSKRRALAIGRRTVAAGLSPDGKAGSDWAEHYFCAGHATLDGEGRIDVQLTTTEPRSITERDDETYDPSAELAAFRAAAQRRIATSSG